MIQLVSPIALFLTLFAGLSIAQQYPLPVTYDRIIKSPINPDITISYKKVNSRTCATTSKWQKQYSGYINFPPLTLAPYQQNYPINTFFWFIEARNNPEKAPLTIWLSGGPGWTSMHELFQEIGPCKLVQNPDGTYRTEPRLWGWDRSSNILFIDQPTQAGFSYNERVNASIDFSEDDPASLASRMQPSPLPADTPAWRFKNGTFASGLSSNTERLSAIAARSSWHFLQGFLSVFPQYNPRIRPGRTIVKSSAINLFAESYGGTYGPIFADYYEEQNGKRKQGTIPANTLDIHLSSVGIINGILDVVIAATAALNFAHNNTYGISWVDQATLQDAISGINSEGGCRDLAQQCQNMVALSDPEGFGDDADTNTVCATALNVCTFAAIAAYNVPRSIYDIRVKPEVSPGFAFSEYLNQANVLRALGAPVNFTSSSGAVLEAFYSRGDAVRGAQLSSLAGLLARGIRVALIHGDADLICNWYGGQNYSLEIAKLVPGYKTSFPAAGYADIRVKNANVGGQVRQFGNLSFSRIYDAGHQAPYYQQETTFTIFTRVIQGRDVSTGRRVDLFKFRTKGPSTSQHLNVVPPEPASVCWIREAADTCTSDERAAIAAGQGNVKAGIWTPEEGSTSTKTKRKTKTKTKEKKTKNHRGVEPTKPTVTEASVPLIDAFMAVSTPTIDKRSGASTLAPSFPFRLPRFVVFVDAAKEQKKQRKIRDGLLGGLASAAALFFGLLSFLFCCRCFRRPRKFPNDTLLDNTEKGPIVVTQVLDEDPNLFMSLRRVGTPMTPIPEASPRPSDDTKELAAAGAERQLLASPLERSVSAPQPRQTTNIESALSSMSQLARVPTAPARSSPSSSSQNVNPVAPEPMLSPGSASLPGHSTPDDPLARSKSKSDSAFRSVLTHLRTIFGGGTEAEEPTDGVLTPPPRQVACVHGAQAKAAVPV